MIHNRQGYYYFPVIYVCINIKNFYPAGGLWWLSGRCLRPLREQHPRPQQIHWDTSRMPGDTNKKTRQRLILGFELSYTWAKKTSLGDRRKLQLYFLQDLCSQNLQLAQLFLHPFKNPTELFCRIFAARTLSAISSPISAPSVTFFLSVATLNSKKISSKLTSPDYKPKALCSSKPLPNSKRSSLIMEQISETGR